MLNSGGMEDETAGKYMEWWIPEVNLT